MRPISTAHRASSSIALEPTEASSTSAAGTAAWACAADAGSRGGVEARAAGRAAPRVGLAARAFRAAAAATRPPRGDFEAPDLRKGDMLRELPCLRCLRGNSASAITVMVFLFF